MRSIKLEGAALSAAQDIAMFSKQHTADCKALIAKQEAEHKALHTTIEAKMAELHKVISKAHGGTLENSQLDLRYIEQGCVFYNVEDDED